MDILSTQQNYDMKDSYIYVLSKIFRN